MKNGFLCINHPMSSMSHSRPQYYEAVVHLKFLYTLKQSAILFDRISLYYYRDCQG
jgi:hypothetical protein